MDGLADLMGNLERLGRYVREAAVQGAQEAAAVVLREAQDRAPTQTGELRESGEVRHTTDGATIAFTAEHALAVHERLDVAHANGEPKFLEHAMTDQAGAVLDAIADAARRAL